MLDKLMKDLKEQNRLADVYYKNEQWALLEWVMKKISNNIGDLFSITDKVIAIIGATGILGEQYVKFLSKSTSFSVAIWEAITS